MFICNRERPLFHLQCVEKTLPALAEEKKRRIKQFRQELTGYKKIYLITHENPDADAIASLALFIWKFFPNWKEDDERINFIFLRHGHRNDHGERKWVPPKREEDSLVIHFDIGDNYEFGKCYDHHMITYSKIDRATNYVLSATMLVYLDFYFPGEDSDIDLLAGFVNARDNGIYYQIPRNDFYSTKLLRDFSEFLSALTNRVNQDRKEPRDTVIIEAIDFLDGWIGLRKLYRKCENIISVSQIVKTVAGKIMISDRINVSTKIIRSHLKRRSRRDIKILIGRYIKTRDQIITITFLWNDIKDVIEIDKLVARLKVSDPAAEIWSHNIGFVIFIKWSRLSVGDVAKEVLLVIQEKETEFNEMFAKKEKDKFDAQKALELIRAESDLTARQEMIEAFLFRLDAAEKVKLLMELALCIDLNEEDEHSSESEEVL